MHLGELLLLDIGVRDFKALWDEFNSDSFLANKGIIQKNSSSGGGRRLEGDDSSNDIRVGLIRSAKKCQAIFSRKRVSQEP